MLWSCTADVLGKNLLHNIYFPAQGWEQKATGGAGRCFRLSGPVLDLPFRMRTSEKHSGVQRRFSVSVACSGARISGEVAVWGWFQFPRPGVGPISSNGWWAVGLSAATVISDRRADGAPGWS